MTPERPRPLLYFGNVGFASIRQRPQQLALELARHADVLWVEPHRSVLGGLRRDARPEAPTAPAGSRLQVLDPGPVPPCSGYFPALNRVAYAATARRIRGFLDAGGLGAPRALIVSFPKHVDAIRHFPGVPVCYDVMDDYPRFFDPWQRAVLANMHRHLLAAATTVVVSSNVLERRCAPVAARVRRIGHGVSEAFIDACRHGLPDADLMALPPPRLGYVGALGPWLDWQAIRALAAAFPRGSLVLVGPLSSRVPALPGNVHLLGPRPHAGIPAALLAMDVGLIPFRRSALTEAVLPVKLLEYLAAGLPVAASPLPELEAFDRWVGTCTSPGEWAAAVRTALAEPAGSGARAERAALAARHPWSARARELLAEIEAVSGRAQAQAMHDALR